MIHNLIFFFLCASLIEASPLYLKDNLQMAQNGDYVVSKQEKNLTLFHIIENNPQHILIEEITLPEKLTATGHNWKSWVLDGAPGHTCWISYELEPQTGRMMHYYFLENGTWTTASADNNLFSQLLNLPFSPQPDRLRKRRGSISVRHPDPFWQPNLIYEGKKIEGEKLTPWQTRWPDDGSELSGKTLLIYIANKKSAYPNYFPYWIEVKGKIARASLHLIDSGKGMHSKLKFLVNP